MDLDIENNNQKRQADYMLQLSRTYQSWFSDPHIKTDLLEKNKLVITLPDLPNTIDLGIVGARQHDLNKRIDETKQMLNTLEHDLNLRLNAIEHKLNIPLPNNIVTFAKAVFTTLKIIDRVYIVPIQYGFQFIIIHNAETAPEAISQTRLGMNILEDEFPDLYFERLVLHTSEVHEEHLQQAKLVLEQRK